MPAPTLAEVDFLAQVTEYAELCGWLWVHFRPAQTLKGWRTPVQGPLGKGWPDLVLIRKPRFIFAELKRDGQTLTSDQKFVLGLIADAAGDGWARGIETYLWVPRGWPEIEETLR